MATIHPPIPDLRLLTAGSYRERDVFLFRGSVISENYNCFGSPEIKPGLLEVKLLPMGKIFNEEAQISGDPIMKGLKRPDTGIKLTRPMPRT